MPRLPIAMIHSTWLMARPPMANTASAPSSWRPSTSHCGPAPPSRAFTPAARLVASAAPVSVTVVRPKGVRSGKALTDMREPSV